MKEQKYIQVIANKLGFYESRRIYQGEAFKIPDGQKLGSWMDLVEEKKRPGPRPKPKPTDAPDEVVVQE